MEPIFRALADPTRRKILDALRRRDGQTLTELEQRFAMTRFGVMKHLKVLEEADLVVTRRVGREKLHYLNPVPIQVIYDRWITKYAAPVMAGLTALKRQMEDSMERKPQHVYQVWIRTTPDRLWKAITDPQLTKKYFYSTEVRSDFKPNGRIAYYGDGEELALDGKIVEIDPPRRLVTTFIMSHDEEGKDDPPSRVTWEIEQKGEMCKLTLIHDGFESETRTFQQVDSGWPYILSGLKTWLETGQSLPAIRS
jgi:uncharacterized protein YndB with AHSA1/START domain